MAVISFGDSGGDFCQHFCSIGRFWLAFIVGGFCLPVMSCGDFRQHWRCMLLAVFSLFAAIVGGVHWRLTALGFFSAGKFLH